MESRTSSSSTPYAVLICALGLAAFVVGIRDIVRGKAILIFGESAKQFTGTEAYWCAGLCLCWGISMMSLAFVVPRAMEARSKRGSYLAIPRWQVIMLIGCFFMLMTSIIGLVALTLQGSGD